MKLSLSWIFDHINGTWHELDVNEMVKALGAVTTEIEGYEKVTFDFSSWTVAQLTAFSDTLQTVKSIELKKSFPIPARADGMLESWYLLKKEHGNWRYATYQDFHGAKEGLLPPIWCTPEDQVGGWKNQLMSEDYIISLDNKAITHRPDLWGHRGFARELAALLRVSLKAEERFLNALPIRHYKNKHTADTAFGYTVEVQDERVCKRLAVLPLTAVECRPSLIWMVQRLALIDARAHDALVDMSNYVMFDMGQPMHAFDAHKIAGTTVRVRAAYAGEKLRLLDNEVITLTEHDCVVADTQKALALAGIMGGHESALSAHTRAVVIESAAYAPTPIRLTAARLKKRTDASIRFEKSLDPNQNTQALLRFVKLLDDAGIPYTAAEYVASIGALAQEKELTLAHDYILKRLGMTVTVDTVIDILKRLGCGVRIEEAAHGVVYTVIVPTYRCSKDITIKEDLLEEIGRFVGYSYIPFALPVRAMKPFDMHLVNRVRALKRHCAYGLGLYEAHNYAFYDAVFMKELGYTPEHTVAISNPVSENWQQLVTSLIPHLLKNVITNGKEQPHMGFFELGSHWQMQGEQIIEQRSLAAVHAVYEGEYSFYEGKQALQTIFDLVGILVVWRKPLAPAPAWYHPHEVAELVCENTVIGRAGKIAPTVRDAVHQADAFIWELDADFLCSYTAPTVSFEPLHKYQAVACDISIFVPLKISVSDIEDAIARADGRIVEVSLIDFFEKQEWHDKRAVTMRYKAVDPTKTFTKEEIDEIRGAVAQAVSKLGAEIR